MDGLRSSCEVMPSDLAGPLSGEQEVQIEFVKKEGRRRKIPVWFTLEGRTLELLPMYGLKTKWFQDVERAGKVEVVSKGASVSRSPTIVREKAAVDAIKKRFAAKYGADDVRKYYPTSQVALRIQL